IFAALMVYNVIQLPPRKELWSPKLDHTKYCPYHRSPGHLISNCFTFRDWVYDLNDAGRINWAEIKSAIEQAKRAPPAQQQANMGIIQNPLPNYQGQQPVANQEQPNNQAHVTTLFTSDEPTCVKRTQICHYEGEEPEEPPHQFVTLGPQGHQTAVIIWEEINCQLGLIAPPRQSQQPSAPPPSQRPVLITPAPAFLAPALHTPQPTHHQLLVSPAPVPYYHSPPPMQ